MDGWLKGLVAAACIVVIAGGAYYALNEYERAQTRAAIQRAEASRAAEAATAAAEQAQQELLSTDYCNALATSALSKVTGKEFRTPDRLAALKECGKLNHLGYVERRDLEAESLL